MIGATIEQARNTPERIIRSVRPVLKFSFSPAASSAPSGEDGFSIKVGGGTVDTWRGKKVRYMFSVS